MDARKRKLILILLMTGIALGLLFIFPWATRFLEAAAMDVRRFWWVILGLFLGFWLFKGPKEG